MTQQFEPFQKVLVRDNDNDNWRCSLLSHIREGSPYKYVTIDSAWEKCIPYEGNEHLVGTSNSPTPPEPEFRFGDKVWCSNDGGNWHAGVFMDKTFDAGFGCAGFRCMMRGDNFPVEIWKRINREDW